MLKFLRFALKAVLYPVIFLCGCALVGAAMLAIAVMLAWPNLPSLDALADYHPKVPLRVYDRDGKLIGEFGEERRDLVRIQDVPQVMKNAILAAEDDDFYQHHGIDPRGILRALYVNLSGGRKQGASTITQQVARNFFLSNERTLTRKFYEALLAFRIESHFTKDQILELYINQIFLGHRSYGFAAAAQTYFGKPLSQISVAEAAVLAGIPKSPSTLNPIASPKRAKIRQEYVLGRMRALGMIDAAAWKKAVDAPIVVKRQSNLYAAHAGYVAEMARQIAAEMFPQSVYGAGLSVYTTISAPLQEAAWRSLRQGVIGYDRRQGFRGAEGHIDLKADNDAQGEDPEEAMLAQLADYPEAEGLIPAVVLEASPGRLLVYSRNDERVELKGDALKFAARYLSGDHVPADKKLKPGDVVRIAPMEGKDGKDEGWQIAQLPEAEAAFIALSPADGAVQALVGGFDFNRNMLNHATQAWRQPGSAFKPFIYSAALEKGYSPGNIVMDTPLTIPASETGSTAWSPKDYSGGGEGPMTFRTALAKSKNIPAVRVIRAITPAYAQDYVITRFGFDAEHQPPYLTMALGAGSVTPWQMASAYAVFANGGYRVKPYIVSEIKNSEGQVLARTVPAVAGKDAPQVLDPRNAYLMESMLRDVAIRGTGARASYILKRHDLAGKTGTTNDYRDAWFCGFQTTAVGCAWIGYDQPRPLGSRETGAAAALPIWIGYMQTALHGVPESLPEKPKGVVSAYGDLYYAENVPSFNPMDDETTWLGYEPPAVPLEDSESSGSTDGAPGAPAAAGSMPPAPIDPAKLLGPH